MSFRGILTLLVLTLLPASLIAQDKSEAGGSVLQQAEGAYRSGKYDEAASLWRRYQSTLEVEDPRVSYNLGNCAYRSGHYAEALWRYEQARKQLGDVQEIAFNSRLARQKLGLAKSENLGLLEALQRRVARCTGMEWFWGALSFEILGLLLLYRALRRRRLINFILSLLLTLGAALGVWHAKDVDPGRLESAIVLADRAELRSEPRMSLEATARVGAGAEGRILELGKAWVRLEIRGKRGWIPRSALGLY